MLRARPAPLWQRLAVALLNGDYARVWRETGARRRVAPATLGCSREPRASTGSTIAAPSSQEAPHGPLTDQAIAKIKDLIMSGEFAAGLAAAEGAGARAAARPLAQLAARGRARADADRRPRAARRRRHVRDEPRAGAPAHGHGVHQRPADRPDAARAPPGAPHPRAGRDRAGGDAARPRTTSPRSRMPRATWTPPRRRRRSSPPTRSSTGSSSPPRGNSTLASLIQNLSGGTLRARLWRSVDRAGRDRDDEAAPLGHLRGAPRPRRRAGERRRPDPPLGGRAWLKHMLEADEADPHDGGRTTRARAGSSSARRVLVAAGRARCGSRLPTVGSAAPTSTSPTATWTSGCACHR